MNNKKEHTMSKIKKEVAEVVAHKAIKLFHTCREYGSSRNVMSVFELDGVRYHLHVYFVHAKIRRDRDKVHYRVRKSQLLSVPPREGIVDHINKKCVRIELEFLVCYPDPEDDFNFILVNNDQNRGFESTSHELRLKRENLVNFSFNNIVSLIEDPTSEVSHPETNTWHTISEEQ